MFYLNSTLNFGILPVLVFQLEVYCKVDRLLTGLTAQPKGTTARWYSNKTSLYVNINIQLSLLIKQNQTYKCLSMKLITKPLKFKFSLSKQYICKVQHFKNPRVRHFNI